MVGRKKPAWEERYYDAPPPAPAPENTDRVLLKILVLVGVVFAIWGLVTLNGRIHETNDRVLQLEKEVQLTYKMALNSKETLDNLCTHFATGCTTKYTGK